LIALLVVGLISAFTHFIHPATYSWLVLGVFTLITLVDFSRIRAGGDGASPVQLAVSIYLDAINIFVALLQLFGMRSRDE
jgi:modulator of FtsH protease